VSPGEAHPQLGALTMVRGKEGKAEVVLQPLFFLTAGNTCAMRRDYWWQLCLSIDFFLCPNKSAVGLLRGVASAHCLLSSAILCSLDSFLLGRFGREGCVLWLVLRRSKSSTTVNYRCCFGKQLILTQILRKEISINQLM